MSFLYIEFRLKIINIKCGTSLISLIVKIAPILLLFFLKSSAINYNNLFQLMKSS
jgi:hypothetical protein